MDDQNLNGSENENKYSIAADTNGAEQQNPYGAQQSPYGAGQNPYGAQQNPYGAQQNPYGTQQNPYGAQQNPYGAQQNPYGAQQSPYGAEQGSYATNGAPNPYGAYGQNPYGAAGNPYAAAQNPYGAQTGITPPKPPKKKMSKKAKILIFGGIGLAAIAVAAVFLCLYVFFPAKNTVKAAIDDMLSSDNTIGKSVLMKELGIDSLSQSFTKEGGEIDLDLSIDGKMVSGKKTDVDAELVLDKAAKKLSGELALEMNGEKFAEAEFFADENRSYATIKDLMKGYFSISNKNILNSLLNSQLAKDLMQGSSVSIPSNIPNFDLDFFSDSSSLNLEAFTSDDNVLWKDCKVGREGSEKLAIGSEMVSTKKYSVTIPKETLQKQVEKYLDIALSAAGNTQYAGMDLSQLKPMLSSIFKEDFVYYVYIVDDKIISIKANGKLNVVMYSLDYGVDYVNYSSDTQNTFTLSVNLGMAGVSAIDGKINIVTKTEGDQLKTEATLTMSVAGTLDISGSYSQTYNKSDKTFSGSGSLSQNGNSLGKIKVDGKVDEIEKGKKLKINFDSLNLEDANGSEIVKIEGSIEIKTKDSGIEVKSMDSSKPVANIDTDSQDVIKSIIDRDSEDYKKFMERFNKATGGIGLDKYIPDDF